MHSTTPYDRRIADKLFRAKRPSGDGRDAQAIARVDMSEFRRKFARDHPAITAVMIPITNIRWLLEQGHDASFFDRETTVISTTTVPDVRLRNLPWEEERDLVRRFNPDLHIPTDYSVYQEMDIQKQWQSIQDCKQGTLWMADQLQDTDIDILVQVKGWKEWHFKCWRPVLKHLNTTICAFYVAGYAGPGVGNRSKVLKKDVQRLIRVVNPSTLVLVGWQAAGDLADLPPEVRAAAGKRWYDQNRREDGSISHEGVTETLRVTEKQLGNGQTKLPSFTTSEVISNG